MKIHKNNKFIYLISPNRITNSNFFKYLDLIFKTKKVSFFQLRLKNEKKNKKIELAKKILKICRKYNVKFIINDDPYLTLKINADGCHLGQNDMNFFAAKKILKNKIIGITCHNSLYLAKKACLYKASYIGIGAFYRSNTKNIKYRAHIKNLREIKKSIDIPIVAIGGINKKNYRNLLLNKADFLAISSYIWNNKYLNPYQAVRKLI